MSSMITTGSIISNTSLDDLCDRIEIVRETPARNNVGDIVGSDDTIILDAWAKVLPIAAKASSDTTARVNAVDYRVIIRYRTTIKPDDVVIWHGKRLKLNAPPYDAENRHIYTVLECREVVADGKTI